MTSFSQLLQRKHCMQYASLCTSYVASQPHTAQLYYCQQLALGRGRALRCSVCCATNQQENLQHYNNKRSKPFSTVQQRSPLLLEEHRLSAFHETNRKAKTGLLSDDDDDDDYNVALPIVLFISVQR